MEKGIITVVGKDQVGIIAKVCTYLADNKLNILDISHFGAICDELNELGNEIGVNIKLQHENIFNKMHRI